MNSDLIDRSQSISERDPELQEASQKFDGLTVLSNQVQRELEHDVRKFGTVVENLHAYLRRKEKNLQVAVTNIDKLVKSSSLVEMELGQELKRLETANAQLVSTNRHLNQRVQQICAKLAQTQSQLNFRDSDVTRLQEGLAKKSVQCHLENENSELETQVRVLQDTETKLRHELAQEEIMLAQRNLKDQRCHPPHQSRLHSDIAALREKAKPKVEAHMGTLEAARDNLQHQLEQEKNVLAQREINELKNTFTGYENQSRGEIAVLRAAKTHLRDEFVQLIKRVARIDSDMTTVKSSLADTSREREKAFQNLRNVVGRMADGQE